MEELKNPDYLFCELPIKDGSINDYRQFIYCPKYLSLIEIFSEEDIIVVFDNEQFQKKYFYQDETFLLVFAQNNIKMVNESTNEIEILKGNVSIKTELEILDEAWEFYISYIQWEDSHI